MVGFLNRWLATTDNPGRATPVSTPTTTERGERVIGRASTVAHHRSWERVLNILGKTTYLTVVGRVDAVVPGMPISTGMGMPTSYSYRGGTSRNLTSIGDYKAALTFASVSDLEGLRVGARSEQ